MGGVFPKTKLLLTNYDIVEGSFNNYSDIAYHLGISINDSGEITFMGRKQYPTYSINDCAIEKDNWKKHEAIADWARYHMRLPTGYRTYRFIINN